MRYWLAVIVLGLIVGAAGHGGHSSLVQDAGTLTWIIGLVMLIRTAWTARKRRHQHSA